MESWKLSRCICKRQCSANLRHFVRKARRDEYRRALTLHEPTFFTITCWYPKLCLVGPLARGASWPSFSSLCMPFSDLLWGVEILPYHACRTCLWRCPFPLQTLPPRTPTLLIQSSARARRTTELRKPVAGGGTIKEYTLNHIGDPTIIKAEFVTTFCLPCAPNVRHGSMAMSCSSVPSNPATASSQ